MSLCYNVIAPLYKIAPVGWPVGEPPCGSRLIASVEPGSGILDASDNWVGEASLNNPSERGLPPAGMVHSSRLRSLAISRVCSGVSIRLLALLSTLTTHCPVSALLLAKIATGVMVEGCTSRRGTSSSAASPAASAHPR